MITVEDLQTFRKLVADKESLEKECEELRRQCREWETSVGNWKNLFEQEKHRADVVQEKRLQEKTEALAKANSINAEKDLQLLNFRTQHEEDKSLIAKLDRDVQRYKGDRWRWGVVGFATGNSTGFVGGYFIRDRLGGNNNFSLGNKIGGTAGNRLVSFEF